MYHSKSKSETKVFLTNKIEEFSGIKVKSIYAPNYCYGEATQRMYHTDETVFIIFENGMCWAIDYLNIDSFYFECRKMTPKEQLRYDECPEKDCFNYNHDLYDNPSTNKLLYTDTSELEYGCICGIDLEPVDYEYEIWTGNNSQDYVMPTEETFRAITFIMDNGNEFTIDPDDAIADGYVFVYSYSANEQRIFK